MHILFKHTFDFPVWRIIPSSTSIASWAVEIRNPKQKTVDYYFVNSDFNLYKIKAEQDWWTGIEMVAGNLIVFHQFIQPDSPLHKGITVYDAPANIKLWENEYVSFTDYGGNVIQAKLLAGSATVTVSLSLFTGEETADKNTVIHSTATTPEPIHQDQTYFGEISTFIKTLSPFIPVKLIEYLETDNSIIISYYVQNNAVLENYLLVSDLNGQEKLHLCIASGLKGIASGTFTVSNTFLSFVKDQHEIFITDPDN